jgi:hypothetical protein
MLRRKFTDGDIDRMLAGDHLTYPDVVAFLDQDPQGPGSLLQRVIPERDSERLLTRWLASDSVDGALAARQATPELYRLVEVRLGLALNVETPLPKARTRSSASCWSTNSAAI